MVKLRISERNTKELGISERRSSSTEVKRWTVGLSHFLGCAEGPSCETEAFPESILSCI